MRYIFPLFLIHIIVIALSNYLVQFPHQFLGIDYTWAMFTYPVVVFATDLTVRLFGVSPARKIVFLAYVPAIALSWYFSDFRIAFASGTAYLVGLILDIVVFQKIREQYQNSWWLPPFGSSIIQAIIDTYLFYSIAFYGSSDAFMASHWMSIANTDLLLKVLISLVIFLPIYGVVLSYATKKYKIS